MKWFEKVKSVEVDVMILPGFNEGYSQRGAWFAWVQAWPLFLKKFSPKMHHLVRWNIREPKSEAPLSDGEIDYLVQKIYKENERFLENLRLTAVISDGQTGVLRKASWLSFILYLFAIITVQAWWLIYLTMPQFILFNLRGERRYKKGMVTRNILGQIWYRGNGGEFSKVLTETNLYYQALADFSPIEKYRKIADWAGEKVKSQPDRVAYWRQVALAYNDIIKKLTGKSYLVKIFSPSPGEKFLSAIFMEAKIPEPENIFSVRNLAKKLLVPRILPQDQRILKERTAENSLNIFLLRSKSGKLVCVPDTGPFYMFDGIVRSIKIAEKYLPLKVNLYVGTEKEKELLTGSGERQVSQRIQNAALDTLKGQEAIQAWLAREIVPLQTINMLLGRWGSARGMGTAAKVVSAAFPWMFLGGGQPAYSLLAMTWIFIYPLFLEEGQDGIRKYFTTVLNGVKIGYHNMVANVKVNYALGHVNEKIKSAPKEARIYRDIQKDINNLALPASLMNQAIFNNVVMETPQLTEAQREACNFTFIPLEIFNQPEQGGSK